MQDEQWRIFWQNAVGYIVTLLMMMMLLRFIETPYFLLFMGAVALSWGSIIARQIYYLLTENTELIINEAHLKQYLDQALAYKTKINVLANTTMPAKRERLERLVTQINIWTEAIENLVKRITSLCQDDLIRQDMLTVPKAIASLEERLINEKDSALQVQLERTLAHRRQQWVALEALQNSIKGAEIQVESTLSLLGTIYSQILTGQSTDEVADYGRLSADVDEEVRLLEDQLEALREVKLSGVK